MKQSILYAVAATVFLGFSSCPQAALQEITICPGKSVVYGGNQEGTLKVFVPNKTLVAKILPELEAGFEVLNPNLGYKVSIEAISTMKSTLDLASSMMRAVVVYYDDAKVVTISSGETGYQMWGITGPISKASSKRCIQ